MEADLPGTKCHKFPTCSADSRYSRIAGTNWSFVHYCSLRRFAVDVVGILGNHTRVSDCPERLLDTFSTPFLTRLAIWDVAFRLAASMVLQNEASTVWPEPGVRTTVVLEHMPVPLKRIRDGSHGSACDALVPETAHTELLHKAQWCRSAASASAEAISVRSCRFLEPECNNHTNLVTDP